MIPYGSHWIDEDDISSVVAVLRQGPITQGPQIEAFEKALAQYVGSRYAVAVSSGTAALHIACLAAGLAPGKKAITSPNTFVATANAVRFTGADVDFADIDPVTLNLDPGALAAACAKAKSVDAILPVHFAGLPSAAQEIRTIASKHQAPVIEDACHALGAHYATGERVGANPYSDMTVFSFHPVKALATGEGGMVTTQNEVLYRRLLRLRTHGIDKSPEIARGRPWYYEMRELGFNYRLTDLQAALGISQLKKLDRFLDRRRALAAAYDEAFGRLPHVGRPQASGSMRSAHHLYILQIDFEGLGLTRESLMNRLFEEGIGTQVHYIPVHYHPYYQQLGFKRGAYPNCEHYYDGALSLPLFYGLTDEDQRRVVDALTQILKKPVGVR